MQLAGREQTSCNLEAVVGRLINYLLCSLQDANFTSSILTMRVSSGNNGAELACRASNPWFSNFSLEDKRIISVACEYDFLPLAYGEVKVIFIIVTFGGHMTRQ